MAAMQLTKTALFGLSKAFHKARALATLDASTGKISPVCFASSFSHSEGKDSVENVRDSRTDVAYGSKKWRENTGQNYAQADKDKTNEGMSKAADKAYETKEQAKDTAYDAKERAKDYAEDTMNNAKATARDATEKVKEYGEDTKERAEGFKETVKDKVEELGEKTKETVKGAWESTKSGAQTMAEVVVGPEEDADKARAEMYKGVEDHTKKKSEKDKREDEFITFK